MLIRADIIVTTPEKWDSVSRSWQQRDYVRAVALVHKMTRVAVACHHGHRLLTTVRRCVAVRGGRVQVVIDEIHMLGQDRGPTLEVIVSRMNYMAAQIQHPVRLVGLSTALANAQDVAAWLGVGKVCLSHAPRRETRAFEMADLNAHRACSHGWCWWRGPQSGLFNFRPSVRPVPLEVHISGFSGKHYCPRMATMNKPAYTAIKEYSPTKPVISTLTWLAVHAGVLCARRQNGGGGGHDADRCVPMCRCRRSSSFCVLASTDAPDRPRADELVWRGGQPAAGDGWLARGIGLRGRRMPSLLRLAVLTPWAPLSSAPPPVLLCSLQFLAMGDAELEQVLGLLRDENLKLSLPFGIGLHHAGLVETDRRLVEELFVNRKVQVLVATSTLAWGVNSPTHLVIIKGTEFFDAKAHRYVDMPITDVLQMMGRAGRPQYDDSGVAVVFVHDAKKNFYKKFLYEPFPVESSLHTQLTDHLNAEVRCSRSHPS